MRSGTFFSRKSHGLYSLTQCLILHSLIDINDIDKVVSGQRVQIPIIRSSSLLCTSRNVISHFLIADSSVASVRRGSHSGLSVLRWRSLSAGTLMNLFGVGLS